MIFSNTRLAAFVHLIIRNAGKSSIFILPYLLFSCIGNTGHVNPTEEKNGKENSEVSTGNEIEKLHDAYVSAWERDDRESAMAFWSDDIVMYAPGSNPHSGTYRGKPEVQKNLIDRIFNETSKAEVLGMDDRGFGKEHVFTIVHEQFEKPDGRVFETRRVVIYRWKNDKIIEVRYFDPDQKASDAFWAE